MGTPWRALREDAPSIRTDVVAGIALVVVLAVGLTVHDGAIPQALRPRPYQLGSVLLR